MDMNKIACIRLAFSFLFISWMELNPLPIQERLNEVSWSNNGLKWTDFQEVDMIPGSSNAIGRTTTKLYYKLTDSLSRKNAQNLRLIKVYSVMLPNKSFIKKSATKKGLLEHEQIHFDINEVEARKFKKELSEKDFDSVKLSKQIKRLHQKHVSNIGIMNNQYDDQHLNPFLGHEHWRNDLNKELMSLQQYTSIDIWIKLKIN
jgi:hypothetical protein